MTSARSATHGSFTIERRYAAALPRVYAAWTDPAAKAQWFACHADWVNEGYELDARIGGREINRVRPPGQALHRYEARYLDVVPRERLIYSYVMQHDHRKISASLATVEFAADGTGTRLTITEHGVFLDGYDGAADRELGTGLGLDSLGRSLAG
jgi:uncharacterized protein YndB with AHSA1/START domain